MKKEEVAEKYIRVGTTLYKTVKRPLISGDYTSKIEIEMVSYCSEVMDFLKQDTIHCCSKDFLFVTQNAGLKTDLTQIRNILKDSWGLHSDRNGDYSFYWSGVSEEFEPVKRKGRFFEIEKSLIDKILL